jgi:hypothetical protein
MAKLVEMLAATQVTLDALTERVQDLEIVAGDPAPYRPAVDAPALNEPVPSNGQPAIEPPTSDGEGMADRAEPPPDEPVPETRSDAPSARVPRPDPASTPDLREW